jgi:hypothetical protein
LSEVDALIRYLFAAREKEAFYWASTGLPVKFQ